MFSKPLYIQVREDQFQVRALSAARSLHKRVTPGFSHPRMLIGDFTAAQAALKSLVSEARGSGLAFSTPVIIHPLEKIEGGLTQVEERLFHELGMGVGATRVVVWQGAPLSDAEALAKLEGK